MKYRNTVTGAIIDVKSKIIGGDWQALSPANSVVKKDVTDSPAPSKRKVSKKKDE